MKLISIENSRLQIIVDDEDYDRCSLYKWWLSGTGSVQYPQTTINGNHIYFHHLVMDISNPDGNFPVLHLDDNPLNNQKSNLKQLPKQHNIQGTMRGRDYSDLPTSNYIGVTWYRRDKCWHGQITHNRRNYHLVYSQNQELLAKRYNEKALELYGPNAKINNLEGQPE
jgi:hypothetical protein